MAEISISKILVDNYNTQEVVRYTVSLLKAADLIMSKALAEENLGYAGAASMTYTQAVGILGALDEKLNGKKEKTVIQ